MQAPSVASVSSPELTRFVRHALDEQAARSLPHVVSARQNVYSLQHPFAAQATHDVEALVRQMFVAMGRQMPLPACASQTQGRLTHSDEEAQRRKHASANMPEGSGRHTPELPQSALDEQPEEHKPVTPSVFDPTDRQTTLLQSPDAAQGSPRSKADVPPPPAAPASSPPSASEQPAQTRATAAADSHCIIDVRGL
jgi:hypothetical protein